MLPALLRYYRDCIAAQIEGGRALNVLAQKDCHALGLTVRQQRELGEQGQLVLASDAAQRLAQRTAVGGRDGTTELGALFVVGQLEVEGKSDRRICAPLLTAAVECEVDLGSATMKITASDQELSINYGLIAELLHDESGDLPSRLQSLSAIVPDFPIEDEEFQTFWDAFRLVAAGCELSDELPARQRQASPSSSPAATSLTKQGRLRFRNFYTPQIASDRQLRLLPATAIIHSRSAAPALSVLGDLEDAIDLDHEQLASTGAAAVFKPIAWDDAAPSAPDAPGVAAAKARDELPLPLSAPQQAAVESARDAPLTVVTGPPGTGKSYTITAMVLDALQSGRSVLITSHMDQALQVVADRVEALVGEVGVARSGGRAAQRALAKKLKRLTGPRGPQAPAEEELATRRRLLQEAHRELDVYSKRFEDVVAKERRWSELHGEGKRLEPVCPLPIHAWTPAELNSNRRLAGKAEANLQSVHWLWCWWGGWQLKRLRKRIAAPGHWELNWDELSELLHVQSVRVERAELERQLKTTFPANAMWRRLLELSRQRDQLALDVVSLRRAQCLAEMSGSARDRSQLRQFATLLRRRRHDLKEQIQVNLDAEVLLRAFPIWCCTNRSLNEILPCEPGLFDLVIIDEASQCDPATAAAALVRGKRAVVVGDPAQLTHVSFLSRAREQAAVVKHELAAAAHQRFRYRRSIYGIAADSVDQPHFFLLNEHFRSDPRIIAFSNREFYDDGLRVMTARPQPNAPDQDTPARSPLAVWQVAGKRRANSSVNEAEAAFVLQRIGHWIDHGAQGEPLSLGVISPFRDHADFILDRLVEQLTPQQLARHHLVVGTAHSLQGDEKDVVILSASVDPDAHSASLHFLQSPNLLNVALTRARQRLEVVTSVEAEQLPWGLWRRFLEDVASQCEASGSKTLPAARSNFQRAVFQRTQEQGWHCEPEFEAAGELVDFAVEASSEQTQPLAVCLDDAELRQSPQETLEMHWRLARAGWLLFRLPHRSWAADWHHCLLEMQSTTDFQSVERATPTR